MISVEEARGLSQQHSARMLGNIREFEEAIQVLAREFINTYVSSDIRRHARKHGKHKTYFTSDEIKTFLRKKGFKFYTTGTWAQGWRLSARRHLEFGIGEQINEEFPHPVDCMFKESKEQLENVGFQVSAAPKLETLWGCKMKTGWNSALHVEWEPSEES